jgi:hypothetical protein
MNNLLLYLLKVSTGTVILYACYFLFFSTDTFYRRNRIYLLMILILPFIIPLIKIFTSSPAIAVIEPVKKMNEIIISGAMAQTTITEKITSANLNNLFIWFYFAIAGLLLLRVLISVTKAYSIIRLGTLHDTSFPKVILSELEYPPFSFFPFIVIPKNKFESDDFTEILNHENAHVRQGHTFDLVFSELLIALLWFNPVMWLIKRSIVLNHEYLADNLALKNSSSIKEYQYKLLNISKDQMQVPLAHNYSSLIKKRIVKINKRPTHNYAVLKSLIIIPVVATLMVTCSLNNDELIPGYYSGTSGDEKFIRIHDYRNSEVPKTDLSEHKNRDFEINEVKWDTLMNTYLFNTYQLKNSQLEKRTDFAYKINEEFDKASYKWVNDSTLKFTMINTLNSSTISYRIDYNNNNDGAQMTTIGMHLEDKK